MTLKHFTLTAVSTELPSRLQLHFADGAVLGVDVAPLIRRYPALAALAQPALFAQARLGEWGGSVVWGEGDDLELAADNLRARAIEQAGGYSHELMADWHLASTGQTPFKIDPLR